ncbi:Type IV pilus assembly protein PilE [uncultured Woeseiaceae bacterium]|uniref:Type IV pilus assembly protein PilE n=1 Tax=uncultured Woeseiaceae bacterium TaxID=1983305 RepID=A0A7D9H3X1_9GAMM|nr:Type IV pilus assembly protein PilE [uncultured Woeseiaceae bacterium]
MKNFGGYDRQAGVTLIELMIVIVIIAIIASAAYPLYTQYVVRAKRSVGTTMLLQVADRQQQYFMDHKRYASSLDSLGFTSNPFMMNDQGALVADDDPNRIYGISLSDTAATTYTATAEPQENQADKDTQCASLTLTHAGEKGQSGSGTKCW